MKKTILASIGISILMVSFTMSYAKDEKYSYEVEFGKSGDEKVLQFNGNGRVNVTGYNGNKVLLSSDEDVFKDDEADEKAKGLRKIGGGGFKIIKHKEKNVIIISRPLHKDISLDVKVPNNITLKFGTSVVKPSNGFHLSKVKIVRPELEKKAKQLEERTKALEMRTKEMEKNTEELKKNAKKLKKKVGTLEKETYIIGSQVGESKKIINLAPSHGIIEGDITINDFTGIVEASTIQGSITVNNMDGIVLANTVEGDINVDFKKLNKNKELYLSTVNGDIDITFPKKANVYVMARTVEGSVFSGFDGDVTYGDKSDNEESKKDSDYPFGNMFISDYITTRINEGGQDIYLNSVNGSIYIRKGK